MSNESIERLTKPYKEHLRESLKTDDDYVGYLSACHDEGPETFALAVQDVLSLARTQPSLSDAIKVVEECEYENVAVDVILQRLKSLSTQRGD
jgi:hypothetical protein